MIRNQYCYKILNQTDQGMMGIECSILLMFVYLEEQLDSMKLDSSFVNFSVTTQYYEYFRTKNNWWLYWDYEDWQTMGSHIELNAFSWMTHMDFYVNFDINDPTNVIKIDHPKNNAKVHLLLSFNCHYGALVPYNDEEEEEKDQQVTYQEYKLASFYMKEVCLKTSKNTKKD